MMIRHRIFILVTATMVAALCALVAWSLVLGAELRSGEIPRKRQLVRALALTDLAIWTEARYTRHPSQADFFSPFQDCPSSLEHFPAGSVVAPPARERPGAGSPP